MAKKNKTAKKDEGVKVGVITIEQLKARHPEAIPYLFVDGSTELNGTRPTLEQLADIKKYFGRDFTLADVELFYEENGLDFLKATWFKVHHHIMRIEEPTVRTVPDWEDLPDHEKERIIRDIAKWKELSNKQKEFLYCEIDTLIDNDEPEIRACEKIRKKYVLIDTSDDAIRKARQRARE